MLDAMKWTISSCYLSDFSHLQQKVAHNEIASLTVASIFCDWHCLRWQEVSCRGWEDKAGCHKPLLSSHCEWRHKTNRHASAEMNIVKSLQAIYQPFWLQCRLLNRISCHVAFYLVVCHASGCFIYAIRWSGKSTDGNMPQANEHQQN